MSEDKTEKVFQVNTPAKLVIKNIRGSVEVHPGEDGIVQVSALKRTHTGDENRTEIVLSQDVDGTVRAATRFPEGGWNWMFGSMPCEVDYQVKAPRLCSLNISGVNNTVMIEGFEGEVSVNSVSGDITLRNLTGIVRIRSVSGDADGERIAGSLEVETVSGDVVFKESSLSSIRANSISGDLRICSRLGEGPYKFKSVSGDVSLSVPPETHCTGELHTVSGDLVSDFPITGFSRHHGFQEVNIQGGGVNITLHSVSGDLSLCSTGEIPVVNQPVKPVSSTERQAVLERVERGELTVDEALGQLHA